MVVRPVPPIIRISNNIYSNDNQLSMIKRLLIAIICIFTLQQSATSQCPGSFSCEGSGVLCSIDALNGFTCNNPVTPNVNFPFPNLCFGVGVPHNLNWWAFIGNGGFLQLTWNFNVASCELGQGIQAGVFEGSCDGSNVWDCNASCNTSNFTLSGATRPCEVYYVWVDGCNGDVCTYTMSVNGSGGPPSLPPLPPLRTDDRVCPCNMFEVCVPDLGDCDPTIEWTVDGVIQGRGECVLVNVPETAQPGQIITVCYTATIGNPDNPDAICDQASRCDQFVVQPIEQEFGRCVVACWEDQPVFWQGIPIVSSCISPPCSVRLQGPDGCCIDSIKSFILLPPPGIGAKDTFICDVGIPFRAENNRVYTDEVCDELIEFQTERFVPECPTARKRCDTSYFLNIGRFKYIKDWEFDCFACSGQVTVTPNIEYDPDCPRFLGQVNILLSWYDALTGDQLGNY